MRILSISAQKPSSTGSGVFLTELVKALQAQGHEQAVIAGVYEEDEISYPEGVDFYPVCFDSEDLPFHIVGMSDEMPYPNTRYCDLTPEMTEQFEKAFLKVLGHVIEKFQPEIILCHHLYLLTSIVREHFPEAVIYGFCHNTDLRQLEKTDLRRIEIKSAISKLDRIYALHEAQKKRIEKTFEMKAGQISIIGMGFNGRIFRRMPEEKKEDGIKRVVFAGKISEKKGVGSLMRALAYLKADSNKTEFFLAGGYGNQEEYDRIVNLAQNSRYQVHFLGRLSQPELAKIYNQCDIFILPSYYEGLPLTVIEALACGDRVIVSDIPGVQDWLKANTKEADIVYVTLPTMENTDEPVKEELPDFEKRIAEALDESLQRETRGKADVSGISWDGLAKKVLM